MIPKLNAEYWDLTEENYSLIQIFLEVALIISVEDQPTLAPLLVSVINSHNVERNAVAFVRSCAVQDGTWGSIRR